MGWFTDFFHNQMQQGVEDIATDVKEFEGRLDDAMDKQGAQRKYSDMSSKPKYRFAHMQTDPYYEQRNTMFPHVKYTRREK